MNITAVFKKIVRMKCGKIFFLLAVCIYFFPLQATAQMNYAYTSECAWHLVEITDSLRAQSNQKRVVALLKQGLNKCPDDPTIFWRLSLNNIEIGDKEYNEGKEDSKELRLHYFNEALYWARKAVEADTQHVVTHAPEMMSTSFAAILSVSGLKKQATLADSVRIYAENAIEIDPNNDRAYHILGRWHYEVGKLGWMTKFLSGVIFGSSPKGSMDLAIHYFEEAIRANDVIVHHYWLGEALLKSGDKKSAVKQFQIIQDMPDVQYNDDYFKQQAKELIKKYS